MGTIGTSIIYGIGTVGGPASVAKFTAVAAAVAGVTKVVNDLTVSSEKYQRMLRGIRLDMSQYNAETKGLIDTQAGLETVIKLQNAEVSASAKQLAALGKAAISYNQTIGGGPGGATTLFEKLTQSIIKGNERALVPYGIQLDETEDKAKAAAEALEKFEAKFGDLEVAVETNREGFFALTNNLGTFLDQAIATVGGSDSLVGAFDVVNDVLAKQTALYEDTAGKMNMFQLGVNGLMGDLMELGEGFFFAEGAADKYRNTLIETIEAEKQLAQSRRERKEVESSTAEIDAKLAEIEAASENLKKAEASGDKQAFIDALSRLSEATGEKIELPKLEEEEPKSKKPRAARSKPEKERTPLEQDITGPAIERRVDRRIELEKRYQDTLDDEVAIVLELETKREQAWRKEFEQQEKRREIQKEKEEFLIKLQGGQTAVWFKEIMIEEQRQAMEIRRQEFRDQMLGIEKARRITHMEEMLGIEQAAVDQSFQIWESGLQGRLELLGKFFGQMALLQNTQSRAMFNIGKVAAIGQSVVDTFLAAQKSYQALAGIPYVGPVLGAAAATAAIAFGVANTKKIASTKYGQKSAPAGGAPSLSGGGSLSQAPSGPISAGGGEGGGTTRIILNLDGQPVHEAIISANDNAVEQGRPGFAQAS
jgi:hypothetical protein